MALDELDAVIGSSLSDASSLSRRVYANSAWSAAMVCRFINRVMGATVATVRADGRPHAAMTLCACLDGTIYVTVSEGSLLRRNLIRRPDVAITVTDREHDITVFGRLHLEGRAAELPALMAALHALTRRGQFTPPGWNGWIHSVQMEKIFISR